MPALTPEQIAAWRPVRRALDPWTPLGEGDDALYQERPDGPNQTLVNALLLTERPSDVRVLLVGARGSGKTTELGRIARRVGDEFVVVRIDLAAGLPDDAGTLAVVVLIGAALMRAVELWRSPDADLTPTPAGTRFGEALGRLGRHAGSLRELLDAVSPVVQVVAPGVPTGLTVALKGTELLSQAARLRTDLSRGPLKGRLPASALDDAGKVTEAVSALAAELHTLAGRPALVLADGLDKRQRLDEVFQALADVELLRSLRFPLVLTGPVNLRHDARFRGVPGSFRLVDLPNLPVLRRDGSAAPRGVDVLGALYRARRDVAGLPADLYAPADVARAALASSGIVREFLELLLWAGEAAMDDGRERVVAADFDVALRRKRLDLQRYLDEADLAVLGRVLRKGVLPENERAEVLLYENFIACYADGDTWYRPHECLVDYVTRHLDG